MADAFITTEPLPEKWLPKLKYIFAPQRSRNLTGLLAIISLVLLVFVSLITIDIIIQWNKNRENAVAGLVLLTGGFVLSIFCCIFGKKLYLEEKQRRAELQPDV